MTFSVLQRTPLPSNLYMQPSLLGKKFTLSSIFPLPPTPAPITTRLVDLLSHIVILYYFTFYYFYNFERQLAVAEKPDQNKFRLT